MKKFTRFFLGTLLMLVFIQSIRAQCTLGDAYGSGTAASTCNTVTASPTCHYIDEYAQFTGLTIGNTYEIGSNVPGTSSATTVTAGAHELTLFDGTGAVLTSQTNATNNLINITFTATTTTVRVQMNTSGCGITGSYCHYYGLRCTSCAGPGAPTCPTLTAPTNNATGISTLPTLTWSAATNATTYDVYIDADATCSITPTTLVATVSTTSYTLTSSLSPSTNYRWMIVPKDCSGAAPASCTPFCFTTTVAPPANDNCTGTNGTPVALTPQSFAAACSSPVAATTVGATQSNTNCSSTATNDDVWFSFTANATTQTVRFEGVTAVTGTVTSMGMDTYTTCGGTNSNCNTGVTLTSGAGQANLTGLTIGTTYFLRVWTAGTGNSATFNICIIDPPPPPANDNCAGATAFPTIPTDGTCVTLSGQTTTAATNSNVTPTGACSSNSGTPDDDVWFSFVAPGPTVILQATLVSGASDVYWQVFSSACGSSMVSVLCTDTNAGGTITGLTTGATYYIRLYTWSASVVTTQDICLKTPPPPPANDNCAGAVALTVNSGTTCTSVTSGTVASATASTGPTSTCGTFDDDVWFSFVATSCSHTVTIQNVAGSVTDMAFQVLTDCGATSALVCSDPNSATISNLTIGNTYYVRVATYTSTGGQTTTFDVCVTTPALMTYVSSTTAQPNTTAVNAGTTNADVIRLEVTVINSGCPLVVSQIQFNTNGTTNVADLTNAKVYYTGTSTTFSTTTAFGSAIANPNGTLTFTGSQTLTGGTSNTVNYFWLAYDIAACATNANVVDGEAIDFTFSGGGANTPTVTAPAGSRSINNTGATFTSVANGNWSNPATWGGCAPTAGATQITINSAVTLDGDYNYPSANLTINSTKSLSISTNTLTIGASGGDSKVFSNSGTLNLTGGTLAINGRATFASGSTYNQSGGTLVIDGNSGSAGTSVASGSAMLLINSALGTVSGGEIIIVDPNFNASGKALDYNVSSTAMAWGTGHTTKFGDGISTQSSANSSGFIVECYTGTGRLMMGNVEVKGGNIANRWTSLGGWSINIAGTLTVDAGSEMRLNSSSTSPVIAGNIVNNGTLTSSVTVVFANLSGNSVVAGTSPQTVSGAGVFRNSATAITANWNSITINNSGGVSFTSSSSFTGTGTGSISSTLTLTSGRLNNSFPLTLGTTTSSNGTLSGGSSTSYVTGEMRRWNNSGTGTSSRIFPIGSATNYQPITINFTDSQTTGGVISALFSDTDPGSTGLPLTDGGLLCEAVSPSGYWTVERLSGAGGTYTADANANGFTQIGGGAITLINQTRLLKRATSGTWTSSDGTPVAPTVLTSVTRTGCTSFSQFALGGTFTALPLELTYFNGKALDSGNLLSWETAIEKDVQWHIVERAADGVNFTEVGRTAGQLSSTAPKQYTLEDLRPIGKAYYRLRSVDLDGKETLSSVIVLERKGARFQIDNVFPSPTQGDLTVQFNAMEESSVNVMVHDFSGRLVLQQQLDAAKGFNQTTLQLGSLPAGMYNVTIFGTQSATEPVRIVKE